MSRYEESNIDDQLEAYLDGAMAPDEVRAFEVLLRRHPALRREIELQTRIDKSLTNLLSPTAPSREEIEALLVEETGGSPAAHSQHRTERRQILKDQHLRNGRLTSESPVERRTKQQFRQRRWFVALAASVAFGIFGWRFFGENNGRVKPFFEPRPLSLVYTEILNNGFRPYYECHDGQRFADTFLKRQGIAIQLAKMPSGSGMLGLSYAGGLSRDTTAILCRVRGNPVVVFVDRLSKDSSTASAMQAEGTNIFRREAGELVLYEVSSLEGSWVMDFLVVP